MNPDAGISATATNNNTKNLMKKTTTILAALAVSAATALAGTTPAPVSSGKNPPPPPMDPCAGPISYNNIELLYAYTDFDGNADAGNGVRLNLEYSPAPNFYLTGGVEWIDIDGGDAWLVKGGLGGYFALTPNIHLAADGGILYADVSGNGGPVVNPLPGNGNGDGDGSDTGWYVRPHLRGKWGCFSLHIGAEYDDVGDREEWQGFADLYYQINPAWDLTAGVHFGEDATTVTAGVRWRY
jgi:hypothetical protein